MMGMSLRGLVACCFIFARMSYSWVTAIPSLLAACAFWISGTWSALIMGLSVRRHVCFAWTHQVCLLCCLVPLLSLWTLSCLRGWHSSFGGASHVAFVVSIRCGPLKNKVFSVAASSCLGFPWRPLCLSANSLGGLVRRLGFYHLGGSSAYKHISLFVPKLYLFWDPLGSLGNPWSPWWGSQEAQSPVVTVKLWNWSPESCWCL